MTETLILIIYLQAYYKLDDGKIQYRIVAGQREVVIIRLKIVPSFQPMLDLASTLF